MICEYTPPICKKEKASYLFSYFSFILIFFFPFLSTRMKWQKNTTKLKRILARMKWVRWKDKVARKRYWNEYIVMGNRCEISCYAFQFTLSLIHSVLLFYEWKWKLFVIVMQSEEWKRKNERRKSIFLREEFGRD